MPFPKKGDLGSASNYRGITLIAVRRGTGGGGGEVGKIYNKILHTDPKREIIRKVSGKLCLQLRKYLLYVDW